MTAPPPTITAGISSGPGPAPGPASNGPVGGPQELYREVQPFHQNMIVRVLVPFETVVMLAVMVPLMAASSKPVPWPVFVLLLFVIFGVPLALWWIRLVTIVTDRELIIRFRPFPGRRVPITAIRSAEAIRYHPLASGGWGWRISGTHHRVFNVSGDRGVHAVYGASERDQFLVGSRDADALAEAIELARFAVSKQSGSGEHPLP